MGPVRISPATRILLVGVAAAAALLVGSFFVPRTPLATVPPSAAGEPQLTVSMGGSEQVIVYSLDRRTTCTDKRNGLSIGTSMTTPLFIAPRDMAGATYYPVGEATSRGTHIVTCTPGDGLAMSREGLVTDTNLVFLRGISIAVIVIFGGMLLLDRRR